MLKVLLSYDSRTGTFILSMKGNYLKSWEEGGGGKEKKWGKLVDVCSLKGKGKGIGKYDFPFRGI